MRFSFKNSILKVLFVAFFSSVIIFNLPITSKSFADTIYLKNKSVLDGKILKEGNGKITLQIDGGSVDFSLLEIERIERTKSDVSPVIGDGHEEEQFSEIIKIVPEFQDQAMQNEALFIIENGWQGDHEKLGSFLKQNQEFIKTAKQTDHATFVLPELDLDITSDSAKRWSAGVDSLKRLAIFLTLDGRYHEAHGDLSKAIGNYIFVIDVSESVLNSRRYEDFSASVAMKNYAFSALKDAISSTTLSLSDKQVLGDLFKKLDSSNFTIKEVLEAEADYQINLMKQQFNKKSNPEITADVVLKYEELSHYYYGKLLKVLETRSDDEINKFYSDINNIKATIKNIKDPNNALSKPIVDKNDFATRIATILVMTGFPNSQPFMIFHNDYIKKYESMRKSFLAD